MSADGGSSWNWRAFAYWAGCFFAHVLVFVVLGALAGAALFPVGGLVFDTGCTAGELAWKGRRFMAFIALIWAPGLALVLCVMKAWRRKHGGAGHQRPG